jgi:predicted PurR-regulated permease PerM
VQPSRSSVKDWCYEHREALLVIIPALILIIYFLYPFLDGLILGTVFAYVGRPIRDRIKSHRRLGALLATTVIIIPIFIVLGLGLIEIANQTIWLVKHQESITLYLQSLASTRPVSPAVHELLAEGINNAAGIAAPIAASIPVMDLGRSVTLGIINFTISIPVCYFFLLDGEKLKRSAAIILSREDADAYVRYTARIDRILSGIFVGSIYTSIVGSLLSTLVFYAFGIPRPLALASLVFISGMVPVLTAWVVILPVTVFRYLTMGPNDALIFFITASALIYIPSEIFIRPYLVSARSSMHPLLVMLSFFGGALVAGIGGFFLAPAVMGILVGIYQERREEMERCGEA